MIVSSSLVATHSLPELAYACPHAATHSLSELAYACLHACPHARPIACPFACPHACPHVCPHACPYACPITFRWRPAAGGRGRAGAGRAGSEPAAAVSPGLAQGPRPLAALRPRGLTLEVCGFNMMSQSCTYAHVYMTIVHAQHAQAATVHRRDGGGRRQSVREIDDPSRNAAESNRTNAVSPTKVQCHGEAARQSCNTSAIRAGCRCLNPRADAVNDDVHRREVEALSWYVVGHLNPLKQGFYNYL